MSQNGGPMAEKIARDLRTRMMSSIRGKDTAPERGVRRILQSLAALVTPCTV